MSPERSIAGDAPYALRPFSATHLGVLVLCTAATVLFIWAGRRSDAARRTRVERAVGWSFLAIWIVNKGWWWFPARFDAAHTLPLQVCDITSLLSAVVLLAPRSWASVLIYFWGIGLSLQALITPDLNRRPDSIWFWFFWISHAGTVAIALYLVAVRGFRPTWRDYRFAVGAGLVYLVIVFTVDVLFDFNYGYVGNARPGQASVIDFLGPWPGRVGLVAALVIAGMAVLMLPWQRVLRRPERLTRVS
jgi:hypothetical integral membrane protein (TIGR02206 family)